jgi:hypothetical protein
MSGKDADPYTLKLIIENKRLRAEVERLHATMEQLTLGGHDPTMASLRAHRIANLENEVERLLRPIGRCASTYHNEFGYGKVSCQRTNGHRGYHVWDGIVRTTRWANNAPHPNDERYRER